MVLNDVVENERHTSCPYTGPGLAVQREVVQRVIVGSEDKLQKKKRIGVKIFYIIVNNNLVALNELTLPSEARSS